ncbi:MAG: chromosome partitioning protein ParB, partial [Phycisphaeraceae bacterium]
GLSVRQVEKLARVFADDDSNPAREEGARTTTRPSASHLNDLEKQIGQQLGTRVSIRPGRKKGSGKLTIEFYSVDAFDDLLQRLGVEAE